MPPVKIQRLYERASSSEKSWIWYDNGCCIIGFQEPQCAKWLDEMQLEECRENKDAESSECYKYRNWVITDQELEEILENTKNNE